MGRLLCAFETLMVRSKVLWHAQHLWSITLCYIGTSMPIMFQLLTIITLFAFRQNQVSTRSPWWTIRVSLAQFSSRCVNIVRVFYILE